MKQTINLGAYGWLQASWLASFYPQDLPEDWRLSYYSNEFNTVLVPADYWQGRQVADCEDWLDDVHPEFQFCIECHSHMFDMVSLADLSEALNVLKPQLSALVFLHEPQMTDHAKNQFSRLLDKLEIDVFAVAPEVVARGSAIPGIWRPADAAGSSPSASASSRFAYIEDDLSDLRAARKRVESFASQLNDNAITAGPATMIVNHPRLQPADLAKFRSVLEIMGF